jgi:hypothetical protein
MRPKTVLTLTLVLFLAVCVTSQAQFLGQLSTAQSPGPGKSMVGGYFGIYEDAFSFFGQYRYGFANYFDGAIKAGFISVDAGGNSEAGLLLGGDLKYQVLDAVLGDPFDLAFGGLAEFALVDPLTILSLGGYVLGSYPFEMRNGRHVSPYGRFNMRMQREEVDLGPFGDVSNTDLEIGLNLGTHVELTPAWGLIGEFFIEDQIGFVMGFDYKF